VPSRGADLGQILRADQATGAVHVLHDHGGLAVDVLHQIFGEQTALDIGGPAGREVDQQGQPLAFVEGLISARDRGGREQDGENEDARAHQREARERKQHRNPPGV
jgi:hypothetical protein